MNRKGEAIPYFAQLLLWPASVLWLAAVKLRAWGYRRGLLRQRRLDGIVISVGNLTVGGTGKTPMVLWLMERLLAEGHAAAVLTRGYAGFGRDGDRTNSGMVVRAEDVSKSGGVTPPDEFMPDSRRMSDEHVPDEARLLMRRLGAARVGKVESTSSAAWLGIGADRYSTGKQLERRGVGWFLLDDGFQHMQLRRDADIVLIDARNPYGNGRQLPAGRLREPMSALGRADVVVITRSDDAPDLEAALRRHTSAPIFYARTKLDAIRRWSAESFARDAAFSVAQYSNQRFFAFCGIGNPRAFFADVRRSGLAVCGEMAFADHHRYAAMDWARIEEEARNVGATALLCTEKDVCNFGGDFVRGNKHDEDPQGEHAAGRADLPLHYVQISMELPRGDEFWGVVMRTAKKRYRSPGAEAR